ncbi:MAG TPA: type II toxin-antitoxin system VapC family toxin [Terriglobia bacterium]|nr:type II toxin-antitoxin system VapC family toxin [Terriglobia bacterium]
MFVVDTNLLVYAFIRECHGHAQAQNLVQEWGSSAEPWCVTWSIVYEFLSVSTQRSAFAHPPSFSESWDFVQTLRAFPSFEILAETERHAEVIDELVREYPHMAGTRFHDLHIAAVMREHGITDIRTADTDFHQFKFLRVTNPLLRSGFKSSGQ